MGSVSLKNWLEIGYKKLEAQKAQETGMDALSCDCLQTDAGPDIAHVVIITQPAQNFFNMFAHLSASADFRVTDIRQSEDESSVAGTTVLPEVEHRRGAFGT